MANLLIRSAAVSAFLVVFALVSPRTCRCSTQVRRITPGFQGSQMNWIDNDGVFLLSNSSAFAFGFTSSDPTYFFLAVIHQPSTRVVWAANPASPVSNSDTFAFADDGDARLEAGGATVWSTSTSARGATAMVLLDSGNLVVLGGDPAAAPLWQSFDHPTDTLLSGQNFYGGMRLTSKPNGHNLTYHLVIEGGDVVLKADFRPPQPYWTMKRENRIIKNFSGDISDAVLVSGSWNTYDRDKVLLWQFIAVDAPRTNGTWAAVLGSDGVLAFYNLDSGGGPQQTRIPQDLCDTPEPCDPYFICSGGPRCQCPAALSSVPNCNPDISSSCGGASFDFKKVDEGVGYFATGFLKPAATRSSLMGCRDACRGNCSCLALFFDDASGNCFLFDQIGSLRQLGGKTTSFSMYIKIPDGGDSKGSGLSRVIIVLIIAVVTVFVIVGLIYLAVIRRRKGAPEPSDHQGSSEEDNFLMENISGMPIRFSYTELRQATDNFSVKLGQGGFGSVYLGKLPDGSRVAVKKLEGIGQGKKEFRAEVSIIGSIHHIHLVRLRGFCAEGTHRLLAYEYMANGSLDRWIFHHEGQEEGQRPPLDWEKRFSIAVGTAKGLAYLHEDCESKIVHCDIKPENVLLDDNFEAKVSDFGLAKLMTREQSHVFTTLRGTRGYLAPEWITGYAISEKSDVYSFGMVLLEMIGGRKNFDPSETSEKAHFPSYAFKKMEERKLADVVDPRLLLLLEPVARSEGGDGDHGKKKGVAGPGAVETAIKVALWCIQEDMALRPSMTKVVQMLEGLCEVPEPPTSGQMGFRLYANVFKTISEEGATASSTSGPSDCNSDAFLSAVRLSGPR
ncbi:hypothetical protein Taro_042730 [Colocasia esculenta]|uniref:Receptor-like serine/threonine-protein kinase n=1 Tax=Colocasia esculenta TaxID=4460 RepID=A0A843WZ60_COLES|nr:hypothetical protein [Colocasia esculenta]